MQSEWSFHRNKTQEKRGLKPRRGKNMRRIQFLLLLAVMACGKMSAPPPPPFDLSLEKPEKVTMWLLQIKAHVAAAPSDNGDAILKALGTVKPPAHVEDAFPLPLQATMVSDPPLSRPSYKQAAQAEEKGDYYAAGRMRLLLDDRVGAKRDYKRLMDDGDWISAGRLAAQFGDRSLFEKNLNAFLEANEGASSVFLFEMGTRLLVAAVKFGHKDWTKAAVDAGRIVLNIRNAESIARAGDGQYLRDRLEEAYQAGSGEKDLGSGPMLGRILFLARCGQAHAVDGLLKAYLAQPEPDVILNTGEGRKEYLNRERYTDDPLEGAAELWKYLGRFPTKQGLDQYVSAVGKQMGKATYNSMWALMHFFAKVRKDTEWRKALEGQFSNGFPFLREMGRLAAGLPANALSDDLSPRERFVVAWFAGQQPSADALRNPSDEGEYLNYEEVFRLLGWGSIAAETGANLWRDLGLSSHVPEPVKGRELAKRRTFVTGDFSDEQDMLWAQLIMSGDQPPTYEFFSGMPHCRIGELEKGMECPDAFVAAAYASLLKGRSWIHAWEILLSAAEERLISLDHVCREWRDHLATLVFRPYVVALTNEKLAKNTEVSKPHPSSVEEAENLVALALEETVGNEREHHRLLIWLSHAGYPRWCRELYADCPVNDPDSVNHPEE